MRTKTKTLAAGIEKLGKRQDWLFLDNLKVSGLY